MGLRKAIVAAVGLFAAVGVSWAADDEREVPAAFVPFEYLVGGWKGAGIPTANRVKGWDENHAWAWKFEKGKAVGLTVELAGNKVLAKGQLGYDPATKKYTLAASDPAGKPAVFTGALDDAGKTLTLDRSGLTSAGAKQRVTLFPNSNFLRYSMHVAEQEKGAPQFKRVYEMSMTKEGEAFAATSAAAAAPKCIVTGGTATMSVTFEGKSYPLCCTGCRDEFNDNPKKYIQKLSLKVAADAAATPVKPAAGSRVTREDDSFGKLLDEPASKKAMPAKNADAPKADEPPAAKPAEADSSKPDPAVAAGKAATLLKSGQNLEKAGKTAAALTYYRQIVKDYPDTPSAKTASARIKALAPEK